MQEIAADSQRLTPAWAKAPLEPSWTDSSADKASFSDHATEKNLRLSFFSPVLRNYNSPCGITVAWHHC